jgi:hypothetical protein
MAVSGLVFDSLECFSNVARLLKARIVKQAETTVARKQLCNAPVPRQWLSYRHVMAAADTHATT